MHILQSVLCFIFANAKMLIEIRKAVDVMTDAFRQVLGLAHITNPCLLDALAVVDYGLANVTQVDPTSFAETKRILLSGEDAFISLGLYDLVKVRQLRARQEFVKVVRAAGHEALLLDPNIRPHQVEELSFLASTPTTILAVNNFYLLKDWDRTGHPFFGNVAGTGPVKKFFKRLFNLSSPTQALVNQWTFKISHEIGLSPLEVNTAMWIIGRR